jgi:hypothetical protein
MPLGVAGALMCTFLSWRYVEAPALRYAARFRAPATVRSQEVASDPYPAGTAVARATAAA